MSLCFSCSYSLPNEFPHGDKEVVLYCISNCSDSDLHHRKVHGHGLWEWTWKNLNMERDFFFHPVMFFFQNWKKWTATPNLDRSKTSSVILKLKKQQQRTGNNQKLNRNSERSVCETVRCVHWISNYVVVVILRWIVLDSKIRCTRVR